MADGGSSCQRFAPQTLTDLMTNSEEVRGSETDGETKREREKERERGRERGREREREREREGERERETTNKRPSHRSASVWSSPQGPDRRIGGRGLAHPPLPSPLSLCLAHPPLPSPLSLCLPSGLPLPLHPLPPSPLSPCLLFGLLLPLLHTGAASRRETTLGRCMRHT